MLGAEPVVMVRSADDMASLLRRGPFAGVEAPKIVISGGGVQVNSQSRWGDYSSMAIDPVDDCTFWYAQEYYKANGSFNFATRLASFKFTSCH